MGGRARLSCPLPELAEVELGSRLSPEPSWGPPTPPPPRPTVSQGERAWVLKSPGARRPGARRSRRCGAPTFQRQRPDPAPTPFGGRGGNFPWEERRARNLLGASCLPGGGGGGGGGASGDPLARGGGGGARPGPGLGLGRPRAAPRWIARRCVRPAAWSPRDAGGSCSRPPARQSAGPTSPPPLRPSLLPPPPGAPSPPQTSSPSLSSRRRHRCRGGRREGTSPPARCPSPPPCLGLRLQSGHQASLRGPLGPATLCLSPLTSPLSASPLCSLALASGQFWGSGGEVGSGAG